MNLFVSLDKIFPVLPYRACGEVVGITFYFYTKNPSQTGVPVQVVYWKEKAWYRNASMNATYMYRGICREINQATWFGTLRWTERVALKRLIRETIGAAYTVSSATGAQYYELNVFPGTVFGTWRKELLSCDGESVSSVLLDMKELF